MVDHQCSRIPSSTRAHPSTLLLHQKFPDMNLKTADVLYLYSIASQQELYMQGDNPAPELQTIINSLHIAPMPVQQIPLRSDQTWAVTINGLTHIHQLMGQLPDGTWQTVKWVAGTTPLASDSVCVS